MESMGIKGGKMPDLTTTQNTPGPIYLPKGVGGIGKQNLSTTATEPRVVIGTGPRFPKGNPDEVRWCGAYVHRSIWRMLATLLLPSSSLSWLHHVWLRLDR